ncbi:MAG: MFS transporter [Victivallales bacterium]|nr:MFS transporter [Victivallales bacterium]
MEPISKLPFKRLLERAYYSGIGKSAVIYPVAFIGAFGMSFASLGFIFYLQDKFCATGEQIGFLAGVWALGYLLGFFYLRPGLYKRMLPRYQILVSSTVMSVFGGIMPLILPSINYIYISHLVYGLAISMFWPPLTAWISIGFEGKKLGAMMSRYNFSWCLGTVLGPLAGGLVCEYSPAVVLVSGACLFFSNSLLVLGATLAMPHGGDTEAHEPKSFGKVSTGLRLPALAGLTCTFLFVGILANIFPVFARNDIGMSEGMIGFMMFCRTLGMTACFVLLGRLTVWHFMAWPLLAAQVLIALLLLVLSSVYSELVFSVLFFVLGLLNAVVYANGQYHSIAGSRDKSFGAALSELLITIGLGAGSCMGGVIYQFFGFAAVINSLAVLMLAAWVMQLIWVSQRVTAKNT